MSRPKFQSRAAREAAELELEPLGSPWSVQRERERQERLAASLPPIARPYYDVDDGVTRHFNRLRHREYLGRAGGMVHTDVGDVHLCWTCCGREELLEELNYDRHGELRPEETARIAALSYYHQC